MFAFVCTELFYMKNLPKRAIFSNGYSVSTQREEIIWKTRKEFGGVTQGLAGFDLQSKARGGWGWGLKGKRNTRSKHFWNCSLVWTDTQTRKWRVCSWLRPRKVLLQTSLKHHGSCLLVFAFMEKNHYSMSLWWSLTLTDLKRETNWKGKMVKSNSFPSWKAMGLFSFPVAGESEPYRRHDTRARASASTAWHQQTPTIVDTWQLWVGRFKKERRQSPGEVSADWRERQQHAPEQCSALKLKAPWPSSP